MTHGHLQKDLTFEVACGRLALREGDEGVDVLGVVPQVSPEGVLGEGALAAIPHLLHAEEELLAALADLAVQAGDGARGGRYASSVA